MKQFRFLGWKVYGDAQNLFSKILITVNKLPKEYRFELSSQIIRSTLSIILNIAEGGGKESDKELNRFIDIALGSAYETLAGLDTLFRNKLIKEEEFLSFQEDIANICSQLGGFRRKIKKE